MPLELSFATCFEVDRDLIDEALAPAQSLTDPAPREKVFALLERMAAVAQPKQGAPRMLVVLARIASASWLDGDLVLRLSAVGSNTEIRLLQDDGLNLAQLRPPLFVGAPLVEFEQAIKLGPRLVAPLAVVSVEPELIELRAELAEEDQDLRALDSRVFGPPPSPPRSPAARTAPPLQESKPTVKIKAVRIPREAFRSDPPEPPVPAVSRQRDPITTRLPAQRPAPSGDSPDAHPEIEIDEPFSSSDSAEGEAAKDDLDSGWD